jgi:para-aminobenzoate synthetase component 1
VAHLSGETAVASFSPLVEELSPVPDVLAALSAIRNLPRTLLMESVLHRERVGRYSFLTADPFFESVTSHVEFGVDPFSESRQLLQQFTSDRIPDLPPFQGGIAGLMGYAAGQVWERLPRTRYDEFEIPDIAVGIYDWVLAWDHVQDRAWIISQGFPEVEPAARARRAHLRLQQIKQLLSRPGPLAPWSPALPALSVEQLAPQFPLFDVPTVTSNFTREGYLAAVRRAIDYIYAGDIFQVNLSQRLLSPLRDSPIELYARLRERNPAPFAGYFEHSEWVLASASPERFVCQTDGRVETRPIKGTRRRQAIPEADLYTQDELRESKKDHSENVMIVDLLRNDLSKVCQPGSICVPQLCAVEVYETVQHLVSQVVGRLRTDATAHELLAATFPGGSITGAPKVRAMEIITEIEPTARGPYCGSLFYIGFDGTMDSSILIRTFTVSRGWIQFPVGGGIVALSDPESEYLETLHKATGMLRALDD